MAERVVVVFIAWGILAGRMGVWQEEFCGGGVITS